MPIIGSVNGTFGHGRSPQVAPPPGFSLYPKLGSRTTWALDTNGSLSIEGNVNLSTTTTALGNVFVLTPTATFLANVKIWGAGGGGFGTIDPDVGRPLSSGAGGAVSGQMMFIANQPYTVFVGAAGTIGGDPATGGWPGRNGGTGGAASGILLGNIFANSSIATDGNLTIAVAGGGAGAASPDYFYQPGGGGGLSTLPIHYTYYPEITPTTEWQNRFTTSTTGVYEPSQTGQALPGIKAFSGGIPGTWYGDYSSGGGGGYRGGNWGLGGQGHVSSDYITSTNSDLRTHDAFYSLPALYDDSMRGTAGDQTKGGKVIIYLSDFEYRSSNIVATGGVVSDIPIPGNNKAYRYHTFTSDGVFNVNSISSGTTIDIFAVGGGGGGSGNHSGPSSGAGGGAVSIRTSFIPTVGNYIVNVGQGGTSSYIDTFDYLDKPIGRIMGGYKGGDSGFYTNLLASKGFPDTYWRLINSFSGEIRYINPSGDDTDGKTINTGYSSFSSALSKNSSFVGIIVFVVLQGTYDPEIPANGVQTPINDGNQPRIFVCAPSRVTINFTPTSRFNSRQDCPMAILQHPLSAIYGAIINRTMFDPIDTNISSGSASQAAFFNNRTTPSTLRNRGSFYNCVFKETTDYYALVAAPTESGTFPYNSEKAAFRVENCSFVTTASKTGGLSISGNDLEYVLFKNCLFSKPHNSNPVLINCQVNITFGGKFVVTGITDKGVYAGEYGWGKTISSPGSAKAFVMIAKGGGGSLKYEAPNNVNYASKYVAPESYGGTSSGMTGESSSGTIYSYRLSYNYPSITANIDYSTFGYAGGRSEKGGGAGGGGAGSPGFNGTINRSGPGGLGIEFPRESNNYFGTGGSGENTVFGDTLKISDYAPGEYGKAGPIGPGSAAGDGIVMVRYVVDGPLTPYIPPPLKTMIAYPYWTGNGGGLNSGVTNVTANYVEHIFYSSGYLKIVRPPENYQEAAYFDILLVGGGGGGAAYAETGNEINGGRGGEVKYFRVYYDEIPGPSHLIVTVGAGGLSGRYDYSCGYYYRYPVDTRSAAPGGNSSIKFGSRTYTAAGGAGGARYHAPTQRLPITDAELITDGLFSNNSTAYGADGGVFYNYTYSDFILPPGANWGNGGDGGQGRWNPSDCSNTTAESGTNGLVIIRYPIYPNN